MLHVVPAGILSFPSGYTIENAIYLDGSSDYLDKDFFVAGTEETWACSFWLKGFSINTTQYIFASRIDGNNTGYIEILSGSGNQLQMRDYDDGVGEPAYQVKTSAVLRDPTAWYHFLCVNNTTNGTSADNQRIYINGIRQEIASLSPSVSADNYASAVGINSANRHYIGQDGNNANDLHGYMAEFVFVDGSTTTTTVDSENKLTNNELGEFDSKGAWVPKNPSENIADFGTNGIYLKFDTPNLLGKSSNSTTNPTVSHLGSHAFASGDTGNTVFTVSSATTGSDASFGDAASNRSIVIAVGGARQTGGTRNVNSVVVNDGSSNHTATRVIGRHGNDNAQEFWTVALPSGTSGTITATFSGSMVPASITWWRVLDLGQPISTATVEQNGYTSLDITTIGQTGDVAFYALQDSDNAVSFSWSDATERAEHINITNATASGHTRYSATAAEYVFTSSESHTETLSLGGSGNEASFAAVTFSNNNTFTTNSVGANNVVVDTCSDNSSAEPTIYTSLDPDNAINQGNAAIYSNSNLTASGNTGHVTLRTNNLTDGASKYVWEVTVTKHDPNTKIGASLPGDVISGGEQLGTNSSTGQGWAFISDNGDAIYHNNDTAAMSSNTAIADGDMYHLEFDNDTGDVYVWRKASGGTWTAENSGNSVTSGSGKTALADKKVHLAGHLYQTSGTNLMTFNFSGPFDKTASSGYNPLTNTATGVGNYATLNPLHQSAATLSDGNTTIAGAGSTNPNASAMSTMTLFDYAYFEVRMAGRSAASPNDGDRSAVIFAATNTAIGDIDVNLTSNSNISGVDNGFRPYTAGSAGTDPSLSWEVGQYGVFAIRADGSGGTNIFVAEGGASNWIYGSGTTGNPVSNSNPTLNISGSAPHELFVGGACYASTDKLTFNFGQSSFQYTPPTGFKGVNTANLPAPTVKNPDDGFALITLENGNTIEASLATARSGFGSFIDVFKREDGTDEDYDVRFSDDDGNSMHFNTNAAAGSEATLASGVNYSAWSWRVGAAYGCYTAAISHDNTSATNQAHGLGVGAKSAVAKRSDSTGDWFVSHPNLSSANIRFNVQEATTSENVTVDDTNVTLSTSLPSGTYRVIVWKQIEGFSAFTGYTHNGSASDGPYVHLGGSASLVAWRNIDSSNHNDFFSTFPSYTSNGNGNPTDVRYNWGNGEKGFTGITIGDVTANGYKMRPSSGSAFGKDADDPMLVWAWGLRPFGGSGVAQAKAR